MRKEAPFGRKWSRRGYSWFVASIIVPTTLAANLHRGYAASPGDANIRAKQVVFDDLFPYMGIRFARNLDPPTNNRSSGDPPTSDNGAQQPNPFSFNSVASEAAAIDEPSRADAIAQQSSKPPMIEPTTGSPWATPIEAGPLVDDFVIPLRRSILANSPDAAEKQPSQWGTATQSALPTAESQTESHGSLSDDSLESIPSILGVVGVVGPVESVRDAMPKSQPRRTPLQDPAFDEVGRATPHQQTRVPATDASVLPIGIESNEHARHDARHRAIPTIHESIASQAREHINNGIQLAQRGAVYSARAQFIKVLRLVSQSLDVETRTNEHSLALANGLRALEEAKQLRPSGSQVEGNIRLSRILMAHRTPVLRGKNLSQISAIEAVQAYHAYADLELAKSGGRELVAADALFGLAKLQPHLDLNQGDSLRAGPVAMSYYQAALMTYPGHYLAANELGVMFARFGQLTDAREVLRFAASSSPNVADIWLNLARVHDRLGEQELAQLAIEEYESLQPGPRPSVLASRVNVQWVEPNTFTRDASPPVPAPSPSTAQAATTSSAKGWPYR